MKYLKANYHAHTVRCKHAVDSERAYIEAAIDMGMKTFGFADHVPIPFHNGFVSGIRMDMDEAGEYLDTIHKLAKEYESQIHVLAGFEAEYIPEFYEEQMEQLKKLNYDYMIMGQHFLESEQFGPYTGTPTTDERMIIGYVDLVLEGMETGDYMYLAHPDLIHFLGDERIYDEQMRRLCLELNRMDIPLEMNILGMAGKRHYPTERFWKIAGEVGNPVIMGLDAHAAEQVREIDGYKRCRKLADKCHLNLIHEMEGV